MTEIERAGEDVTICERVVAFAEVIDSIPDRDNVRERWMPSDEQRQQWSELVAIALPIAGRFGLDEYRKASLHALLPSSEGDKWNEDYQCFETNRQQNTDNAIKFSWELLLEADSRLVLLTQEPAVQQQGDDQRDGGGADRCRAFIQLLDSLISLTEDFKGPVPWRTRTLVLAKANRRAKWILAGGPAWEFKLRGTINHILQLQQELIIDCETMLVGSGMRIVVLADHLPPYLAGTGHVFWNGGGKIVPGRRGSEPGAAPMFPAFSELCEGTIPRVRQRVRQLQAQLAARERSPDVFQGAQEVGEPDWDTLLRLHGSSRMTYRDVATKCGVDISAFRQRINRWRNDHLTEENRTWYRVEDRGPRDPEHTFQFSAVLPLAKELWAYSKTYSERTAPKKKRQKTA